MRVPGRRMVEQILQCHTDKKVRISKEASKLMFLHYVIFLRKLARECDNFSFRQRKMQIKGDAVSLCSPKLLTAFCETEKIILKAPKSMREKKTPEKTKQMERSKTKAEDIYDAFDDEADDEDASESEETE